jgi:diguanylate cyclase (GGDEF)-like protein
MRRRVALASFAAALALLGQVDSVAQEEQGAAQRPTHPAAAPGLQAVRPAPKRASLLPVLTTAAAVHNLTPAEAGRQFPVHLRAAVCVVCFTGWHGFFVSDGATGIFVETRDQIPLTAAIRPGTLLEIEGVTGPGEYAPIVDHSSLRILGKGSIPPARPVSLDRLSTGVEDGQWVSFEGTVRSVGLRDSMRVLLIASGRMQVEVMTAPESGKDFARFVNARVRVQGTVGPVFNQRRQLVGTNVYTPSLDNIRILEPAPADPFSIPLKPVRSVFEYTPGAGTDQLVRIRGVVAARWGQTVFINDGVQTASVLGGETTQLAPGDVVDAVGYPALGDLAHTIDDAMFRHLGKAPLLEPKPVGVKEALSGDFEGDLVRMEGRLIEQQKAPDLDTLLVDADDAVFSAVLPQELKGQSFSGLRDGSRIQLTGVCVISETQASRHFRLPKAFEILLRTPSDVVVLERAPWWTPGHALEVLAIMLAGTLFVLGWVVALRKQVERQTSLLRESEERFRQMAHRDSLTGLATRVLLDDRLNVALEAAKRHKTTLGLLMLDLDKFKEINDTFGHHAGDEVLRVSAARILGTVRKSDTIARMGGDEFVVLLPELSEPALASTIAAKIVAALSVPISFSGMELPISVSVGVCTTSPGNEQDAETLLKNVDTALYQAKARGRNRFQSFAVDAARPQTA